MLNTLLFRLWNWWFTWRYVLISRIPLDRWDITEHTLRHRLNRKGTSYRLVRGDDGTFDIIFYIQKNRHLAAKYDRTLYCNYVRDLLNKVLLLGCGRITQIPRPTFIHLRKQYDLDELVFYIDRGHDKEDWLGPRWIPHRLLPLETATGVPVMDKDTYVHRVVLSSMGTSIEEIGQVRYYITDFETDLRNGNVLVYCIPNRSLCQQVV